MNRSHIIQAIFCCIVYMLFPAVLHGATFDVTDGAGFQSALDLAAINGEDDDIHVASGSYTISSPLTYFSGENFDLNIYGSGNTTTILDAGGLCQVFWLSSSGQGNIYVDNLLVQHGAGDYGAGFYADTVSASITLVSVRFIENNGTQVGGGANIYSNTGSLTVLGCGFNNNSSGRAGGLFAQSETGPLVHVAHCSFLSNTVTVDGGGCMLYPLGNGADVTVIDNRFGSNGAGAFGGGCWVRTPGGNNTIIYRDNELINNHCDTGEGGGTVLEIFSGSIEFSGNTHRMNSTGVNGGGAWVWLGSGTMTLCDSIFLDNGAVENGGGLDISMDSGTAIIRNMLFSRNTANNVGAGASVSCGNASISMINNSFNHNYAQDGGGGITFYSEEAGVTLNLVNQIVWDSQPTSIAATGTAPVAATYSNIENGTGETWFGEGCISIDPVFADPDTSDLHLESGSPCIDAGNSTGAWEYDYEGQPRYDDPGTVNSGNGPPWVDMGADEYNPVDPTVTPAPSSTPTPSPTGNPGETVSIALDMGATTFQGGDTCYLDLHLENSGQEIYVDIYVLLEVYGQYWCYPGWRSLTEQLDWDSMYLPYGYEDTRQILGTFVMPETSPVGPLNFIAAVFDQGYLDIANLVSNVSIWEFYLE